MWWDHRPEKAWDWHVICDLTAGSGNKVSTLHSAPYIYIDHPPQHLVNGRQWWELTGNWKSRNWNLAWKKYWHLRALSNLTSSDMSCCHCQIIKNNCSWSFNRKGRASDWLRCLLMTYHLIRYQDEFPLSSLPLYLKPGTKADWVTGTLCVCFLSIHKPSNGW